jgi:CRP-like cAMP-binding protein
MVDHRLRTHGRQCSRLAAGAAVNKIHSAEPHERLIRKLESIAELPDEERTALRELPMAVRMVAADSDVVSEGESSTECCLLIEGLVCRYKILPDGGRQIFSFHVSGDIVDLQSLHLRTMDHSVGALSASQVGMIPHQTLHQLTTRYPRIAAALWRDTLIDAAIFREWLAGVGRRSAKQRIAHLFCELYVKLRSVGLGEERGFELALTQAEMGDALGLSTVHVNRVLQELRTEGLVSTRGRFLNVVDWEGLCAAGDFDPAYLHLSGRVAV